MTPSLCHLSVGGDEQMKAFKSSGQFLQCSHKLKLFYKEFNHTDVVWDRQKQTPCEKNFICGGRGAESPSWNKEHISTTRPVAVSNGKRAVRMILIFLTKNFTGTIPVLEVKHGAIVILAITWLTKWRCDIFLLVQIFYNSKKCSNKRHSFSLAQAFSGWAWVFHDACTALCLE